MDRWIGKVAVVTGASSGNGAAIAKDLTKAGLIVIGLARRTERIDQFREELKESKGQLHSRYCDVSDLASVKEAFEWIESTFNVINIIVNNAGITKETMILSEEDSMDAIRSVIDTNLLGVIACTQNAYRIMKRKNVTAGHIVNINSIGGHKVPNVGPDIHLNVYPSTKHGITALTEVIRQELNSLGNKNIRVTSISPGLVLTEIIQQGGKEDSIWLQMPSLKPENVSDAVMYALGAPPDVQVHELTLKAVGEYL